MQKEFFFRNKNTSVILESCLPQYDSLEEFEEHFPTDFLDDDSRIGDYLSELLGKYDKDASCMMRTHEEMSL